MRPRSLPILLFAIFVVSSCDNDPSSPIDPPAPTTEEQIIADCYVVRDALEAFAAQNGGAYPDGWHRNDLIAFLPGGSPLTNRYTSLATVPVLWDPQWPGEIGVVLYSHGYDPPTGYRIVGRGRYSELIRIENLSGFSQQTIEEYDSTLSNCDIVVVAAEAFSAIEGNYPGSVSGDLLPNGDVMCDLLPNGGALLTNPFYGWQDSPVDGSAGVEGQIGYTPEDRTGNGTWQGFIIDALGADGITVIARRTHGSEEDFIARSGALRLRSAAEEFASANDGEYPRDIDTDETPAGDTLLELASCTGCGLSNPYTGASPYRDGLATSRGEVGYIPLEYDGIVVGYVINALGLFNVELERFEVLSN